MPNLTEGYYDFEFLVNNRDPIQTDNIVLASGQNLVAGAILAKTFVGTAAGTNAAGNTGNPTIGAITVGSLAEAGLYRCVFIDATHFEVFSPAGGFLGSYATGAVANLQQRLSFTITVGGTGAVAGDEFDIVVTEGASTYAAAVGGDAVAILGVKTDATAGATATVAVTRLAEFNVNKVNYGAMDAGHILQANAALAKKNLIARTGF